VISLVVFIGFATIFLKEGIKWNYLVGFGLIILAVFVIFYDWKKV
jgi:uncharacterized protein